MASIHFQNGTIIPASWLNDVNDAVYTQLPVVIAKQSQWVSVKDFGAVGDGVTDDTAAIKSTFASLPTGGTVYFPFGTYLVSSQININPNTIVVGNNSTISAPTTGYHVFNATGSLQVGNLKFTRNPVAQNTTWKAINCDYAVQVLPAGTNIVVQNCSITNFDIGVYCDGGQPRAISYAEVSGCTIIINTLGTGGNTSVRPTVNLNNCNQAIIQNNPLLDASDRVNEVNNIYCIGCGSIIVQNNYIYSGCQKVVTDSYSSTNATDQVVITGNRHYQITWWFVGADKSPIHSVDISDNYFDTLIPSGSGGAINLGSYTSNLTTGDSVRFASVQGNYFVNVPKNVHFISLSAGNSFGTLLLNNNKYYNTSTQSSGTYAIVNYNNAGTTYRSLICSNEDVLGNSNTRAYLQNGNPFANTQLVNINEVGITGQKTGYQSGSFTATLVGCTTSPTATVSYSVVGGLVTINIPTLQATSNSTSCSLTGLPVAIQPQSQIVNTPLFIQDNGVYSIGQMQINPASGTITLQKNGVTAGWTASGSKGTWSTTVTYLLT